MYIIQKTINNFNIDKILNKLTTTKKAINQFGYFNPTRYYKALAFMPGLFYCLYLAFLQTIPENKKLLQFAPKQL